MSDWLTLRLGDTWLSVEKPGIKRKIVDLTSRTVHYHNKKGEKRWCSRRRFLLWVIQSGAFKADRGCGCHKDAESCWCGGACNCH